MKLDQSGPLKLKKNKLFQLLDSSSEIWSGKLVSFANFVTHNNASGSKEKRKTTKFHRHSVIAARPNKMLKVKSTLPKYLARSKSKIKFFKCNRH